MRWLLALIALVLPSLASAHPGGLDASGCHHDRKHGGYHCHGGARAAPDPEPVRALPERPPPHPQSLFAAPPVRAPDVPILEAGTSFVCTPVLVWDGDGPFWCAEGPHVRIRGIAAREMDGSCRPGQPCPSASAISARDALVVLLGGSRGENRTGHVLVDGPRLDCISDGWAKGNRTAARCALPDGRDLATAMIGSGTVLAWDYSAAE